MTDDGPPPLPPSMTPEGPQNRSATVVRLNSFRCSPVLSL
jgi:hypothetical protein